MMRDAIEGGVGRVLFCVCACLACLLRVCVRVCNRLCGPRTLSVVFFVRGWDGWIREEDPRKKGLRHTNFRCSLALSPSPSPCAPPSRSWPSWSSCCLSVSSMTCRRPFWARVSVRSGRSGRGAGPGVGWHRSVRRAPIRHAARKSWQLSCPAPPCARCLTRRARLSLSLSLTYTNTAVQPTEATWWWWNRPWGGGWGWNGEEGCAVRRAGRGHGRGKARAGRLRAAAPSHGLCCSLPPPLTPLHAHTHPLSLSLCPLSPSQAAGTTGGAPAPAMVGAGASCSACRPPRRPEKWSGKPLRMK